MLGRRAVVGGMIGVVAGGALAGGVAGAKNADDRIDEALEGQRLEQEVVKAPPVDHRDAFQRMHDLQVAYEVVDDFPNGATNSGRVGTAGWTVVSAGDGSRVANPKVAEGGVVSLVAGPTPADRCGMHLDMGMLQGSPLFTMEWRVSLDGAALQEGNVFFGAVDSVEVTGTGPRAEPATGQFFRHDRAIASTWQCVFVQDGKRRAVDSKVAADDKFHRFGITSDSTGLLRFYIDDRKVAIIGQGWIKGHPYGHGIELLRSSGSRQLSTLVDWFYLRRETAR